MTPKRKVGPFKGYNIKCPSLPYNFYLCILPLFVLSLFNISFVRIDRPFDIIFPLSFSAFKIWKYIYFTLNKKYVSKV